MQVREAIHLSDDLCLYQLKGHYLIREDRNGQTKIIQWSDGLHLHQFHGHHVIRAKRDARSIKSTVLNRDYSVNFAIMINAQDDLQARWWKLEEKFLNKFEKKPDVEAVLFLIGVQEVRNIKKKFTKEQKQDLMHVAVCTLLAQSGYYEVEKYDEDGWPHFKQLKALPEFNLIEQENFLKDHILLYFDTIEQPF